MSIAHLCALVVIAVLNLSISATVAQSTQREDVMGVYRLSNEKQCQRLCWYRPLCTSFSYFSGAGSNLVHDFNCVLHTTHAETVTINAPASSAGWSEKTASNSDIRNACRIRVCDQRSICIPSYSTPSSVCVPVPSACGRPQNVTNGDVIVLSGTQQDDVARVQCYDAHIATPRNVSTEMTCQVTSTWTVFQGTCSQYEFKANVDQMFRIALLGPMTEYPTICISAVNFQAGQYYFSLLPDFGPDDNIHLHVAFRYDFTTDGLNELIWNVKVNGNFVNKMDLGPMPLVPGDNLNLTLHVHSDRLQLVLNEVHVYNIPLLGVNGNTDGVDLSQSAVLEVYGSAETSYVNLLSGC